MVNSGCTRFPSFFWPFALTPPRFWSDLGDFCRFKPRVQKRLGQFRNWHCGLAKRLADARPVGYDQRKPRLATHRVSPQTCPYPTLPVGGILMNLLVVRRFLVVWPAVATALLACVIPCQAQEWTRFRGPNGSGQSDATTIPTKWTDSDYNWKIDLPGIGHSSPVIWGDKLFVTSADPKQGTRMLFAVRTSDGKVLWEKEYTASTNPLHAQNSYASSSPACDADHVYVAWASPQGFYMVALDHAGNEVWRENLGEHKSRHGFGTSPIVYEDLVIMTNDHEGAQSYVMALDRGTGKTRWKVPRKSMSPQNASYSAPMIYTPPGGQDELIINSWAHGISSHNPKTGEVNWEAPVFELRTVGSPVLAGGLIWGCCGEGAGNNSVVAIDPPDKSGDKPSVAFERRRKSMWPYVPTIIAAGNLVFLWGDGGIVTCVDARTRQQLWQERIGGTYSASPIRIGDRIFGISTTGEVVVLAASPEFQELARIQLGDDTRATPAVAGGMLFLRTQSKLMSIGGKKSE
jgi:outer membrane protein assembly factor BamB